MESTRYVPGKQGRQKSGLEAPEQENNKPCKTHMRTTMRVAVAVLCTFPANNNRKDHEYAFYWATHRQGSLFTLPWYKCSLVPRPALLLVNVLKMAMTSPQGSAYESLPSWPGVIGLHNIENSLIPTLTSCQFCPRSAHTPTLSQKHVRD
jgi:hypothetical protein